MAFEGDLQDILEPLASGGCYPVINDSASITYPYITYTGIFKAKLTIHSGTQNKRRVQIDVFGNTYGDVKSLMEDIDTALETSGVACAFINEVDAFEEVPRTYRGILEYYFWA
jgi:hypothetical protein